MRHIGVDLHKTNFVVCFLHADETTRLETYPLTEGGLQRFTAELAAEDAEVTDRPRAHPGEPHAVRRH